jgi:putative redox protein
MSIRVFFPGNKKVYAEQNGFIIQTDQPQSGGGDASAPSPYELFLASLATCGGIFVKGFCDSRGIPADNIELIQNLKYDTVNRRVSQIKIEINVPPEFPAEYYQALVNAVNHCSVKKLVYDPPEFVVETVVKA